MIIEIKRKFKCTYSILEVETQEGGCTETTLRMGIDSPQMAISVLELIEERCNCNYYIVLDHEEMPA